MADVEEVRAHISEMVRAVKINACVPTMRYALLLYKQALLTDEPSGLSVDDKKWFDDEHRRLSFLLTDVFPSEEEGDGQAD